MLVVGKVQVTQPSWILREGNGPLVAVALHDGHDIGAEVSPLLAVSESDRTREEDPFTAMWTTVADTQIVVKRSRFEFDLNRPREQAVYLSLEDSWGLSVWHTLPSKVREPISLPNFDLILVSTRLRKPTFCRILPHQAIAFPRRKACVLCVRLATS